MKKEFIVKQHDLTDCGPACLLSIIKYYGGYVPIETLRFDSFTDKDGTNAFNLIKCANKYGLSGVGEKVINLVNLPKSKLPCIAHLKLENGLNHFVVIYKVNSKDILIMDPAKGKVKLEIRTFNLLYSGVIILLHPFRKIEKLNKPKPIKQIIMNCLLNNKLKFFLLIISSFIIIVFSILLSYFIKIGSNMITNNTFMAYFFSFILIYLIMFIIKNLFEYLKNHIIISLNRKISLKFYNDFSNKIFHLPLNYIRSRTSGEIVSRYNELSNITEMLPNIVLSIFLDLIMVFVAIYFSFSISYSLSIIVVLFMTLYFIVAYAFKNPTLRKVNKNLDENANLNSNIIESINNLRSIKNLHNEDNMKARFNRVCINTLSDNYYLEKYYCRLNFIKDFIYDFMIFSISSYGLLLVYIKSLNIVDLFTFLMVANYYIEPIKDLIDMITKFCFLKTSINKINEFSLAEEHDRSNKVYKSGDILVSNLSYAYNGIDYIIKNYSCVIKQKSKVLLQGNSGSGKSTLCQLISKQLNNYEGNIYINKNNINDIQNDSIRKNITYIGQKDTLIFDTIENNIKYERKVDKKYFKTICKICEIDKIVENKYDRFNSIISDSSDNISGGEKQRITLARGLINSGDVLILDESLSEVNQDMEERIVKRIISYFKNKTIIYVSHKNYHHIFDRTIKI